MTTSADAPIDIAEPVMKKAKAVHTAESEYEFCLEIQHLKSFRQMVDVVGSVLRHIFITITPRKTAGGGVLLSIDTVDPNHVCMCQARLVCDGSVSTSSTSFCVDTETLIHCLRNVPKSHTLQLMQKKGSAEVTIKSFDGLTKKVDLSFEMATFDETPETMEIDALEFEYYTEADMPSLRGMIKLAKDLHCELLNLTMYVDAAGKGAATGTREAILAVSGRGQSASFTRFMPSVVRMDMTKTGETGNSVNDGIASMDTSKLTACAGAEYSLEYLTKMLKSMEDQSVRVKTGDDMPLLLHYALGVEDSFVRFVLAPRGDEE